ncbi:uncharacterized protein NPIL_599961 [Nephila pilipes]|uniref:Uncharacterized protein n=1 Tax=Nephila pilipes TaxID=299642 RepID=A0A8X6P6A4_NEPPI|nr:uncharacterized protein NPIL_599961 [Nephila pilipes]
MVLKLAVNGTFGTTRSDTGASHTIAVETLYLILEREGVNFQKTRLLQTPKSPRWIYTTSIVTRLEGHVIRIPLIILPYAKGNRILLEMDFLEKDGIALNFKHHNWLFSDSPHRKNDFVKEVISQEI